MIEFLTTRWNTTLVQDPGSSSITVTDKAGSIVPGVTLYDRVPGPDRVNGQTVYNYNRYAPYKGYAGLIMTFVFQHDDGSGTVIDHLTAAGAPYTVSVTATARNFNGTPGETVTLPPQTIALDRFVPAMPKIVTPEWQTVVTHVGCKPEDRAALGPAGAVCNLDGNGGKGREPINVAPHTPGTRVVISGTVADPLTAPYEDDPEWQYYETSGIAAVVIRLYGPGVTPNGVLRKSYFLRQDCAEAHPVAPEITRCPSEVSFSVDVTADLVARNWHGFDIYAIDAAGLHHELASNEGSSPENLAGPITPGVGIFFTG